MTAPTHLRQSAVRTLVVALATALSLLVSGPAAQAHTDLIRSSPSKGDRLESVPSEIELEFTESVDPSLSTIVLIRAGSDPVRLDVVRGGQPAVLLAMVPEVVSSTTEAWSVGYRVTSVDGHPIEGSVDFVVAGSGAAPPEADGEVPSEKSVPSPVAGAADTRTLGAGQFPWQYAGPAILIGALVMLGTLLGLARLAGQARATNRPSTSGDEVP